MRASNAHKPVKRITNKRILAKRRACRRAVERIPTVAEAAILGTLAGLRRELGRPPTRREIAATAGITLTGVQNHLDRLVAKGYVRREKRAARGAMAVKGVKIVGTVGGGGEVKWR